MKHVLILKSSPRIVYRSFCTRNSYAENISRLNLNLRNLGNLVCNESNLSDVPIKIFFIFEYCINCKLIPLNLNNNVVA